MIKEENYNLKNTLIGFGVIFLYLILSSYVYDFLDLFGINYNNLPIILKKVYVVSYNILLTSIIIYIYKEIFITSFKNFKNNIYSYLKKYIIYWILALALMLLSNFIITMFTTSNTPTNQKIIIDQIKSAPIYTFIIAVIVSPILEELVYRISFRKIFPKTNLLFILFSGLFFGMMHVIGTLTNSTDLLFIIPYSIPGFIFAYTYYKSNNICIPISLHFIHNLVMMIFQILIILI